MLKLMPLLVTLFSICGFVATGQNSNFDTSICWKVQKDGSPTPSYIVGSVHQMDTTQINFPIDTICKWIDECQATCFEIFISNERGKTGDSTLNIFLENNEKNITNSLDEFHLAQLNQIIDSSNYYLKPLKPLLGYVKPTVMSLMLDLEKQLSGSTKLASLNFAPDLYFQEYAKNKGYEIFQLETVQQQSEWIMPNTPFDESIEELKETIDQYAKDEPLDLFLNYQNQTTGMLEESVYTDSLMVSRNQKMTEGIDRLITQKPIFIMVGAAHLPFENGVLNLLSEKGYRIQPVVVNLRK